MKNLNPKFKSSIYPAALVCFIAFAPLHFARADSDPTLTVYTYDNMIAKGGLGEKIFPLFERRFHCHVKVLASGDAAQMATRMQLDAERGNSPAQVVLGIDQQIWPRVKAFAENWGGWIPHGYGKVSNDAKIEEGFLPFDYGFYALMLDTENAKGLRIPTTVSDLGKLELKKKWILEDPRTSAPGLAFLIFTQQQLGAQAADFWKQASWLTLPSGWEAAYGLFLKGEAPLVWSYTTSQAYHRENGDSSGRYKAILFREGQPIQIEGAAIIHSGVQDESKKTLAKEFLEFIISPEVQREIPTHNWMLPVLLGTKLPSSFSRLPKPKHVIKLSNDENTIHTLLSTWTHQVESAH